MKFKFKQKRKGQTVTFKDLLPSVLEEMQIQDIFSIEELKTDWEKIVGNLIAAHSMPDRIFKHTLFIAVDHSIFANDIVMMQKIIVDKINKLYSNHPIVRIKAEVKKFDWNKKNS